MTNECPACGTTAIRCEKELERFQYGQGRAAVTLEAMVPVYSCEACEFRYTDHEAESARHDAVCRHLQLMTPAELLKIRNDLGMSREELSEISGLGVASIARWELGATVQNKANDNYLFLLSFGDNRSRLVCRFQPISAAINSKVVPFQPTSFRSLRNGAEPLDESLCARAKAFQLQKRG